MADEKTEEPTERKLEKAREDGSFPKSQEFCSAIVFAAVLLTLLGGGKMALEQIRTLMSIALDFSPGNFTIEALHARTARMYVTALWLCVPVTIVAAVAGTLGMVTQIGLHVSFKPVTPKLENISPIKGIKKIFSVKVLLDLLQMIVRAIVIGLLVWWLIRSAISLFAAAGYQTLPILGATAWRLVLRLLELSLLCFMVMSAADYAIQRWQFMKGHRMSKDEVRREYKESEGDPIIKSARMQIAREAAHTAGTRGPGIQSAKVILTNPTHYAVALAFEPGVYDVPVVVARGADEDARLIREEATRLGIPIFSNPPLARALYKTPVNCQIPSEFYAVVAALMVWLQRVESLNYARIGILAAQAPAPESPA